MRMSASMIAPRCLIRVDESTASFPGIFAEPEKWFRRLGVRFVADQARSSFTGLRVPSSDHGDFYPSVPIRAGSTSVLTSAPRCPQALQINLSWNDLRSSTLYKRRVDTSATHCRTTLQPQLPPSGAVLLWNAAMSSLGVFGLSLLGLTIGGTLMAVIKSAGDNPWREDRRRGQRHL